LAGIRILGVLQRIGVCYLIASACVIFIPKFKQNASGPFRVLITYMWHWLVALAMLVIYLGLMLGIWVPGCPQRGMLTPACNAAGFIDYHVRCCHSYYRQKAYSDVT
jgi:predicted acyltransferase